MGRPRELDIDWNDPEDVAFYHKRRREERNGPSLELVEHEEIGRELGISPQRVGQIERQALAKMRNKFERLGIKFYDL